MSRQPTRGCRPAREYDEGGRGAEAALLGDGVANCRSRPEPKVKATALWRVACENVAWRTERVTSSRGSLDIAQRRPARGALGRPVEPMEWMKPAAMVAPTFYHRPRRTRWRGAVVAAGGHLVHDLGDALDGYRLLLVPRLAALRRLVHLREPRLVRVSAWYPERLTVIIIKRLRSTV